MDNNIKFFKTKLIKISYIDYNNKKLYGFLFNNKYIKKDDRLPMVKKYIDKNAKQLVSFEKVDGFIPIDIEYINRFDIDYHL